VQKYLINDGQFRVSENNGVTATLLACRQLLIKTASDCTLIDTGIGVNDYHQAYFKKFTVSYPRGLLNGLLAAGIAPESVTNVVLTHLHFDHAGGLHSDDNGVDKSPFVNAKIYLQQKELDYALTQIENGGSSVAGCNVEPLLNNNRVNTLEGDYQLTTEISLIHAGGHTPGLQIVRIQDQEQIYYFASDLLPTPYHINHDLNAPGIDFDKEQMQIAIVNLLETALKTEAILIFNHSPAITAGRIVACQNGIYSFKSVKLKELPAWEIL